LEKANFLQYIEGLVSFNELSSMFAGIISKSNPSDFNKLIRLGDPEASIIW
jgi:hypothetical protein